MDSVPPPVVDYPRPHLQGGGPACPSCGSTQTKEVKYTWWGGLVGPKMMNLQKCENCRIQFNRKTNKNALNAIIAYNMVALLIGFVILFALFAGRF